MTAIRLAEPQFALPSGALPPPHPSLSVHATQCHPELPTVSAEEPKISILYTNPATQAAYLVIRGPG
ncbi:MAG TPA: hypothetical protein VH139_11420, partial [Acidobacteriaceae bacterium]|nr:hypothetical protein [Acidobacteriaceae bacterium]